MLDRHQDEAGIIYCIRRTDVDELAAQLRKAGRQRRCPTTPACADEERQRDQEAFAAEKCDVVVATVAFGMGIDRSNIRFVLHTAHAEVDRALPAGDGPGRPRRPRSRVRPALCGRRLQVWRKMERRADRRSRRGRRATARDAGLLEVASLAGTKPWWSILVRNTKGRIARPATSASISRRFCRGL